MLSIAPKSARSCVMRLQDLTYTFGLPAQPEAPRRARRHAQRALAIWQAADEDVEVATLLVSELVTNAVTHGSRQSEGDESAEIVLTLRKAGARLWITVRDGESAPPFRRSGLPDIAEAGRGITIVSTLAERWGYDFTSDGGKDVWCVLPLNQKQKAGLS
ncbi:ATP-binding protein [Streptomyces sp. NPDC090306]|uniref:ATP-binding protein n=1 Tax=Streptomyces sp. NPDC090306 TaxID=3365961 RepID=UPI003821807F